MTPDEHQRERMRTFREAVNAALRTNSDLKYPVVNYGEMALAEFDKRFPAPAAVEVAPVPTDATEYDNEAYSCGWNDGHAEGVTHGTAHHAAELATLREKARLFDALASGKITLCIYSDGADVLFNCGYDRGSRCTDNFSNAAEAVQAAIDAGVLK